MSRADELRDARGSYSVGYTTFIKIIGKNPDMPVLFFEGLDLKYYGSRIRNIRPDLTWAYVECGGKEKLLKIYSLVQAHDAYSKKVTAFFVDKDFALSKLPCDQTRLYCTPCYSVENFYISTTTMSAILEAEYNLARLPDEKGCHQKCIGLFEARLQEFLDSARLLNAWVFTHRRHEMESGSGRLLDIDSISLSKLIDVNVDRIESHYSVSDLEEQTHQPTVTTDEELIRICQSYDAIDPAKEFRGKFLAYFLRNFLTKLAAYSKEGAAGLFPEPRKIALQVSDKNFLSDLCQYAETPDCLRKFIEAISPQGTLQL